MRYSEIAVIIPVYNAEKYLDRCIKSLLCQTIKIPYIVYLIDDGSKDNSFKIMQQYKKNHPDLIEIIHKDNGGQSSARNVGLRVSKSKYICFIDSDDYIDKRYLGCLYSLCLKNNADISMCSSNRVFGDDGKGTPFDSGFNTDFVSSNIKKICMHSNYTPWCKMFKRNLFDGLCFPEGMTYEDMALIPQLLYRAKKICYTNICLYHYYVNPNSTIMSTANRKRINPNIIKAMKILEESELKNSKEILACIYFKRIIMSLAWTMLEYNNDLKGVERIIIDGHRFYSPFLKSWTKDQKGIKWLYSKHILSDHYLLAWIDVKTFCFLRKIYHLLRKVGKHL